MPSTRSVKGLERENVVKKEPPASVLAHRTQIVEEPPIPKEVGVPVIKNYIDNSGIEMKYDFDDILIVPTKQTHIESRYDEINPYTNGYLPLFAAPMDTVTSKKNWFDFHESLIYVVYPRTEKNKRLDHGFNSFGLEEFEKELLKMSPADGTWYVLIDIANGHMSKVIRYAKLAKQRNPNIVIMAGNIANPETYRLYCESGAIDYARVGIGNGNGCLTTQQTGVGYPMGSLIAECNEIKSQFPNATKIVADGGMKKYSDIIRALALGADYVMLGSIFNKALESAAPTYWHGIKLPKAIARWMFKKGFTLTKEFRGMSTKKSQELMGNTKMRTSEGVVKKQIVEYTLDTWAKNFESYYRTALSYTNCKSSAEFVGKVKFNIITQNAYNRYNK